MMDSVVHSPSQCTHTYYLIKPKLFREDDCFFKIAEILVVHFDHRNTFFPVIFLDFFPNAVQVPDYPFNYFGIPELCCVKLVGPTVSKDYGSCTFYQGLQPNQIQCIIQDYQNLVRTCCKSQVLEIDYCLIVPVEKQAIGFHSKENYDLIIFSLEKSWNSCDLLTVCKFQIMLHNYKGQMRRVNNENIVTKNAWDRDRQFYQTSKPKYQKSQISYYQSQSSVPFFEDPRSERPNGKLSSEGQQQFNDTIPVKVKSTDREHQYTVLRIQIKKGVERNMPYVQIYLTDDCDPLFLWIFKVKETDFINLKNEQCLKVDFSCFPEMMSSQLGLVQSQRQSAHGEEFFYLVFEIGKGGDGSLNILQSRKYKETNHLSLKFKIATDQQIKFNLSSQLRKENEENQTLKIRISKIETLLEQRKKELERLSAERRNEQEGYFKERQTQSKMQHDKLEHVKNELQSRFQVKEKELTGRLLQVEDEFKRDRKQHERKIKDLDSENKVLESRIQQLTIKYETLQCNSEKTHQDLDQRNRQITSLERQRKQLSQHSRDQQRTIISYEAEMSGFKRQLNDKQEVIEAKEKLNSNESKQICDLEENSRALKEALEEQKRIVQELRDQCKIERKQREDAKEKYQKKKEKVATYAVIIKGQEEQVVKFSDELKEAKDKIQDSRADHEATRRNYEEIQREHTKLRKDNQQIKLDSAEKQKMIDFLHKQLNEKSALTRNIIGGGGYTSSLTSGLTSTSRDLSGTTESRLKYSNANLNIEKSERGPRIDPPVVRRYTGTTPIKERPRNQDADRTLSPSMARLNQQADPQENPQTKTRKIQPVKFKFGQ